MKIITKITLMLGKKDSRQENYKLNRRYIAAFICIQTDYIHKKYDKFAVVTASVFLEEPCHTKLYFR